MSLFFGIVALGVLLATFRTTSGPGLGLAGAGLWAALTWFGVTSFVDPFAVVVDGLGSRRGADGELGVRLQGGFFLLLANAPLAMWLWARRDTRRRARPPRPGAAEHRAARQAHLEREQARRLRLAAKRRRKRDR